MIPTTFELREIPKLVKRIQIDNQTLNLENVLTYTISEGLFKKPSLTVKLKTGEVLVFENINKDTIQTLFRKK